jgi:DeoR family fructose operon transcriptional repressor
VALKGTIDAEARRAAILSLARSSGTVALDEAASTFDVHPMTIRRDFEALERDGIVRRVRGGIMPVGDDPVNVRRTQNFAAKRTIAAKIIPLISSSSTIGMDASTTVGAVAEALGSNRHLTVVTNGLFAFDTLARNTAVRAHLTGGEREQRNASLVGMLAQQGFEAFHFDVSVISGMGVHADSGTSESTLAQAAVKDSLARVSRRLILAVDSSKLQSRSSVRALNLDRISTLVTELAPADPLLDPFRPYITIIV